MKNKIITLFILISFSINYAHAQIEQNIFKTFTPEWIHKASDSTALNMFDTDGNYKLQERNWLIKDGYIYLLYYYNLNFDPDGGYLEKVDLMTGELIWCVSFDLRTIDINENPNKMFFNEQKELVVMGFRGLERKSGNDTSDQLYKLVIRKYNPENGTLITKSFGAPSDSSATSMYANGFHSKATLYPLNNENYQFFYNFYLGEFDKIHSLTLDSLGKVIDSVDLDFTGGFSNRRVLINNLINNKLFASVVYSYNNYSKQNDSFDFNFHLILFDREFNSIKSFDITDDLEAKNRHKVEVEYTDNDFIILKFRNEPELFQWKYYYMIYDYHGNLLEKIDVTDASVSTIKSISSNEFLIIGSDFREKQKVPIKFYMQKIGEEKKLLRTLQLKNISRLFVPKNIYIMENNDIVLRGNLNQIKLGRAQIGFPYIFYLRANDIWDYVNTKEVGNSVFKINLYPNPVKNILSLDFNIRFTGTIDILDINGREVKKIKSKRVLKHEINVSELKSGTYFIRIINSEQKDTQSKMLKFIKY